MLTTSRCLRSSNTHYSKLSCFIRYNFSCTHTFLLKKSEGRGDVPVICGSPGPLEELPTHTKVPYVDTSSPTGTGQLPRVYLTSHVLPKFLESRTQLQFSCGPSSVQLNAGRMPETVPFKYSIAHGGKQSCFQSSLLRLDAWWRLWWHCGGARQVFYGFLQLPYILEMLCNEYV